VIAAELAAAPIGPWAGQLRGGQRINPPEKMALRLISRLVATGSPAALRRLDDGELMALARDGNAHAFEVIFDRHVTVAFSLALRVCGARAMAEDAVQEAFLSLWRGRDRYDARRGAVRAWLLGIVRNAAIDRLRRSSLHERRRASDEAMEERLEARERTEAEVERLEQAEEVHQALRTLPGEQRRVIELAYFDGLSHTQIAAALSQPVGTVKGRMRLGLLKLQAQLEGAQEGISGAEGAQR
jgi:RNA polymerase sigma-70 factor, ECF subfamily